MTYAPSLGGNGEEKTHKKPANPGRPRKPEEIWDLIIQMAQDTGRGFQAHNLEVVDSNPAPATSKPESQTKTAHGLTQQADGICLGFSRSNAIICNDLRQSACLSLLISSPSRDISPRREICLRYPVLGANSLCLSFAGHFGL